MFYLTTHSIHFIYGYMASDIWLRTILIARKETCCCHMGYSYRLTARVLLYAPSHRQDNTYHILCYTSRGALAGTRNSSMGPAHEGSYPGTWINKQKQFLWIISWYMNQQSSMGPAHEGSTRRPTAPWANALPLSYVPLLCIGNHDDEAHWPGMFREVSWRRMSVLKASSRKTLATTRWQ